MVLFSRLELCEQNYDGMFLHEAIQVLKTFLLLRPCGP